jgi:hypothetical protein
MLGPLRAAGLAHDCGVPSFDAFVARVEPGCNCCSGAFQGAALQDIARHIDTDQTLTPSNRELACDMVLHLARYSRTSCRNCALGWGILFTVNGIWDLALMDGASGGGLLGFGMLLLMWWGLRFGMERCSEKELREREEEALNQMRGLG